MILHALSPAELAMCAIAFVWLVLSAMPKYRSFIRNNGSVALLLFSLLALVDAVVSKNFKPWDPAPGLGFALALWVCASLVARKGEEPDRYQLLILLTLLVAFTAIGVVGVVARLVA